MIILSLKADVNVPSKNNKQKDSFFVDISKTTDDKSRNRTLRSTFYDIEISALDRHQHGKSDTDRHQNNDADPQHCLSSHQKFKPFSPGGYKVFGRDWEW